MKGVQIRFYNDSTEGKMLSRKGSKDKNNQESKGKNQYISKIWKIMYKRLNGFPIRSGMTKESIFVDGQRGIVLVFTTIITKY